MSGIADRLAQLSPERRAALQELLRKRPAAAAAPQEIRPLPRDGGSLPASFAQRRLWFVQQMEPRSWAYNMAYPLRLAGGLDARALRRALTAVVARHEALRTTLEERGGEPVQVIHPPAPVRLPTIELRGIAAGAREREARRLVEAEARRPFDLARGPLLRTALLRTGDDEAVVLLAMHHAVTDGWSMEVLVREVSALYAAEQRGEPAQLPPLPVQYADYAAWQRAWLSGETLAEHVGWWRAQLEGAPTLLEMPTDRPRPAVPGDAAAYHGFSLGRAISAALQALARREGATPFMTLLAAWQLLLARYAGQDDVLVGTPIAGRNRRETEGLIGFFVNTLVLRAEVRGEASFADLLRQVRERTLGAYQHQELPFEKLVEELGVERSLAHTPLFQVTFALQNNEQGELSLGGAEVQALERGGSAAKFDLMLSLGEAGDEIGGGLEYRSELWEAATIERMAGHYLAVLEAVAAAPEARLSELQLLGAAERRQVLEEWNRTDAEYPAEPCVHRLFEAQAERAPDAAAVLSGAVRLTYAELNRRADGLAHRLRGLGVGPETRVGLCLERGAEMVACVLAVLKAGGAYVPLDPAHPRDRLAWMLADSGARVLLTQSGLAGGFDGFDGEVVRVDETAPAPAADLAPSHAATAENLAYVLYTSGSTGRPKGVLVQHGSLANLLAATREAFGVGPGDVMPALASYAFDIWLFETLLPLTSGAAVRLVERERILDPDALVEEVSDATLLHAVPALMRRIAQAERERPRLGRLRRAFVGGDRVPADLLAEMRAALPSARISVLYGPTEGTILASTHAVPESGVVEGHPIGRPLGNVRLYVCDAPGNPQPVGVPGELRIGGAGVARGYLGQPGRTAEGFVPDAFSGRPGARLYRAGDRVRRLASGELEFLGRMDQQVKVRGFRIEPGEIEARLREHPGVREAAVLAREDAPGQTRLVAYVVGEADAEALRAYLGRSLPEHMVPGAFVALERLPLTPNGKLDRGALPAPEHEAAAEYVAPRTATEEVLAGIWAEVLGVERVGVTASFFALGGHSLLATRVVSRARQALGVELPLRALFEAPTVAALAERVEALRAAGRGPAAPPIVPVPREGSAPPLSFAQQRLWLVDRIEPGSAAYNMPSALRLRGALDVAALRAALDALVRRHETLRTTFAERGGVPAQVIHPPAAVPLPLVDLRALPAAGREARAERLARAEAMRPFDLARGPLLRCTLLCLGEEDHVLCFTLHHVVGDGWSMQVLVREVSATYGGFVRGEPASLPELPIQYADYAVWQRGWLSGETLERQLDYWRTALADAPPLLDLPTDHPRPPRMTVEGAVHAFSIPAEVVDAMRELSRLEGATLFMTFLAAWNVLLSRRAGQDDVLVGTPIAGRTRVELEGLIGFFVNTLVIRTDLSDAGRLPFRELLGRVRESTLGAYQHQELPFEKLVEELQPERSLQHTPLFQAMFVLQNLERSELRLGGLETAPLAGGGDAAAFDLVLTLAETGDAMHGVLSYRSALWEAETVARMGEQLGVLLRGIAADPSRPVAGIPLLPADERAQVLEGWNRTGRDFPDAPVHELFAAQVERAPDATALVAGELRLSYAELDRESDRLAHHLRRLGVGVESRVAIWLERSPELVVAGLAVLKAGGAFVPLDPAYPVERLAFMLADSGARVVLTREALAGRIPAHEASLVLLDRDPIAAAPQEAPRVEVPREATAYVIYTSGSTGRPKGVAVPHRGVPNLVRVMAGAHRLTPRSRVLQFASPSFDAAVFEIFFTLGTGAALYLPPAGEGPLAGAELAEWLTARGITHLTLSPSALAVIPDQAALPTLETLMLAGEALPAALAERWAPRVPRLLNAYGPTEATVCATIGDPLRQGQPATIGRPVANVRTYVLDPWGGPVPVGVPGELYVGGVGVARGYVNRPGLTAERFVPDGFGREAGGRLYRTGDRARWLASGELEFLGRVDDQVKIRGYRIEPGEIESVLRAHPGVRDAVAVAREDAPGEKRLVAYVVPEEGEELPAAGLRASLAARLPEYMVPAAFVALERLPLTANGKLDRRALPAPERETSPHAGPRTEAEEVLAGIWAEVLRLESVGTGENFFELGGHSLLATQVVSRARQAFGAEVPLKALFESPTVAGLAARIQALRDAGAPAAPPIARVARTEPPPLSFAQQRLWLVDRIEPGSAAYNMPSALRLRGMLDVAALRAGLDALVRRHETLRTVFAEHGGEAVQVVCAPAPSALPVVDLRALPEAELAAGRLAAEEALRPFDLARGPLLRGTLLRLGEEDHVLCLTMHHVVSDGWSMDVLTREVSAFYEAFSRGAEPRLPELPVQYADFAVWQRAWLSGPTLEAQLAYWRERLAGAPAFLELPTDRPRPAAKGHRGGMRALRIGAAAAGELRAFGRREDATPFMTLLAAFSVLLARWSGQADVVVGIPIAGRTRRETEGLIGFFLNTLALRTDLSGDPTFREVLGRVRETTLGAYAHQDLPFERILEEIQPPRSLGHSPVFQVMLNLQNLSAEAPAGLEGLRTERFGSPAPAAKYDLTLYALESDGGIDLSLVYDADLFEDARAAEALAQLGTLLAAAVDDPEQRVSALPLLTEEERRALSCRARGVGTDRAFAGFARGEIEQTIPARFAAQARLHPDRPAVRTRTTTLTYAELDRAAEGVARAILRRRTARPERVALLFEHDAAMIVGMLGVLKAGKTYVPIDPLYPRERSAYVLEDSGAAALVTNRANLELARELAGGRIALVDVDSARAEGPSASTEARRPAAPGEPAYILYTSGSTGRPKGVVQSHRNVLHFIRVYTGNLRIGSDDRLTLFSSYTFDASVMAIYGALLNGATLCPFDWREEAASGVAEWMRREGITLYHSTPTVFRHLAAELAPGERFPAARLVVLGGEEAQRRDLDAFNRHFPPGATLVNGLGPTESTVTLQHFIGRGEEPARSSLSVGHPVEETDVLLLNGVGEQAAVYGVGEIVIRGPHLALGYWGSPERTAAAFTPDPAGGPLRCYRTGDLGRRLPGGGIEFIGRSDFQLKVRGFRVEPGEVEAALREHPAVRQAAAAPWEDDRGERRLAAYWVPAEGADASTAELRAWMRERIPEYMVPSALVRLDALPLTPSGKVDRLALPAPELQRSQAGPAPSTPEEAVLAEIFADVLGRDAVGTGEDFFELGGHSLRATRVVARVREAFGVELPLRALFEAPTVAGLARRVEAAGGAPRPPGGMEGAPAGRPAGGVADRLARLSPERRAALQALRRQPAAPPEIRPRAEDGPAPLSFAQQRLWFLQQMEPRSWAYNLAYPLRIFGALDARTLRRVLAAVVRRHEALRTTLEARGGEPVQVVHPAAPGEMPVLDLRGLPAAAREREAQRLAEAESRRPFDLARGPLLRTTLLRLGDEETVALFTVHHVVSDGWSMGIFVREVSTLYDAVSRGAEAHLPPLPIQYADYAAWQRARLSGETLEEQLAFWREQLWDAPPLLELPTDRPRPAVLDGSGAALPFHVRPAAARALRALGQREGATPFMTLLAAWQLLLGRYAGTEDVVVGTPIAGRTHVELEGLIGFFVNTLVLRTGLSGEASFRELLGRVRESTLAAYQHQEIPFEKLVEELGADRGLDRTPLFQVMLTFQNTETGELVLGGLRLEPFAGAPSRVNADLSFTLGEAGDALTGAMEYRTTLFDPGTVARHLEHFGVLLEEIAADPERDVRELSLLSAAERRKVVAEWNDTAAPRSGRPVHESFDVQAERTPGAVAAVCGSRSLTYAELRRRADLVAARLRARGIGRGSYVPVLLDRGLDVPVALLGVLKSGAAFSPLDVHWPLARIRTILDDLGCGIVLGNDRTPFREEELGRTLLRVDVEDFSAVDPVPGRLDPVEGEDPIYVIYTSGSTGTPKGVVVPHRGIANRFRWMDEYFGTAAAAAVVQTTRHVYDSAVWQLLWPLVNGGRTVLPASDEELAAEPLAALVREHGVTMTDFVPSVFNTLVPQLVGDERLRRGLASLRVVVVGGEQITPATTYAFLGCFPEVRVVNLYGPTEASIGCICHRVTGSEGARIPIGRPIRNTHALVLDGRREPVPVGVPGELYLSGECLGLGYLHDEARTREVFVDHPFPELGYARAYRTGDRVRWRADGNLEYLGRVDQQVKIRGFRIEPGEVEAALRGHPGVREAVVHVREDEPGERRLVAYTVPEGEAVPVAALRSHLRERLPEYMVPAAFVSLEALPLTPGGKLDGRALPAPERTEAGAYVAPRTPVQEVLAGIWAEILRLERVSVEAGFFDLGGHSLLATRVVSRVREALGVELPLRALFEAPTVAALAGRVEALRRSGASAAPPIVPVPRDAPLPPSFAQQRLWFLHQMEPASPAYNMPNALRLRGPLDVAALRAALDALARRHETLRTTFAEVAGAPVQVIHPPAQVELPLLDLRGVPHAEREAERLAAAEALRPFDLARGPLLRSMLLRLGDADHALLFTLHHVVSDGWSMDVLTREVSALYDAFSRGGEPRLPELPVQYADFAVWQRSWLTGETLEAQLGYWRGRLAGAPPLLEIPTDRPRAVGQDPRAAAHAFLLPPGLSRRLRELSRGEGTTLFMTLLAGWQALLGRWSGQDDVVVGTAVAGRSRRETEGLIGFFVNLLALRADLSGDPAWAALLGRTREAALGAYDHQELPFDRLVEELGVERSLTHSPVFQTNFTLEQSGGGGGGPAPAGPGLEPFAAGTRAAKFDLDLVMGDAGEALAGTIVYRPALFDAGTVARMAAHLAALVEAMAADPRSRVSAAPLLGGAERAQLLEEWSATSAAAPPACFHELFAEQAARTPEAVAVVSPGATLSYAELEREANRLAGHLRRRGVGPEARVAVCLERGADGVVALLGVLAAGGVYVPLDPAYPAERLAYVLADSGARLLLTRRPLLDRLPAHAGETVCLDADGGRIAAESARAPGAGVLPENLAYVIYTSGTTGRPKGVLVPHRGLAAVARAQARQAGVGAGDRLLQFASPGFDASVSEMTMALASGATLVSGTRDALAPGPDLLRFLREEAVTAAILPPAALAAMTPEALPALRTLMSAGEACPAEVVDRWAPGRRFFNLYGPTEATICATAAACEPGGGRPPIGRPLAGTTAYVLDAYGEPVPVGVPGELYVGGVGVARGYGGRPEPTAERFVPDRFGEAGARLYRTGDRARWRPDGELEFLGRVDAQVKIRGFRVEPGEIESVLRGEPGVADAVVVVREDVPGDRRIVAYAVPREGAELSAAELSGRLAGRLPEYMVPRHFVALERIPLTPNGKLDRRALPRPSVSGRDRTMPRDPLEATLVRVFEEVLGATGVGPRDSFFELGGHSLLAVRLMSALYGATGARLPLTTLFRAPTVEGLAGEIRRGGGGEVPVLVPLRATGSRAPLVLVHPGGGSILAYGALAERLGEEQPVWGVRSRGIEEGELPNRTVEAMARDYLAEIRARWPEGPYRLGGWSMGGVVAFEMARQLDAAGEGVETLVLIDSQVPSLSTPDRPPPGGGLVLARMFARDLGLGDDLLPALDAEAGDGGEAAYLRRLLHAGQAAGRLPASLDPSLLERLYGIFRINLEALHAYRPGEYGGSATLLRAADGDPAGKPDLGWGRVVRGGVDVRTVPGTHHTMVREPRAEALAREMERALG